MHATERGGLKARSHVGGRYETRIPVLGIMTHFASNSPVVIAAVDDAFGDWRSLPPAEIGNGPAQTVHVTVQAKSTDNRTDANEVKHYLPGDGRLIIHSRAALGSSDPRRGKAWAWVGPALLRDRTRFRYDILEALTWALLTRCDRQPLHAAALVRDGAGLLLCGPSGAGKSTLACAAARAGMRVLAEDMVFLQTQPQLRVWGMPAVFRLLPDAAAHLDGLGTAPPAELHNGRRKIVVRAESIGAAAVERVLDTCGVCVLGERRASPECRRLTAAETIRLLNLTRDPGFDAFAETIVPAVERLVHRGAWLLNPSPAPAASMPLLARMLDEVARVREETRP